MSEQKQVQLIKACGFRVYMRDPADEHCFYTDGTNIGYAQWSRHQESVTSVHIPNRQVGSGFHVADEISEATIRAGLCLAPNWVSGVYRAAVKKWRDWDAFSKASTWNAGFKEV